MTGDEWAGAIFEPGALRHFSLLPDEDADEAYCLRHDREMRSIDPVVHTQGALYTTADGFSVYTCPACLKEVNSMAGASVDGGGLKAYQLALMQAFDQWDQGEAPGDWFRYLCEGSIEDLDDDRKFIAFTPDDGGDTGGVRP